MLLLLAALPALLGLSFVFDLWGDEDDPIKVTDEQPYFGGDNDDEIEGNSDDNIILAGGGGDNVSGGAGNDLISGEAGNDNIEGNAGNDLIFGAAGDDEIAGNEGNDVMVGNGGDDILNGGAGADTVEGGSGNDELFLGAGDDESGTLTGNDEPDDALSSFLQVGDDLVHGGQGNDQIFDRRGANALFGDAGDDYVDALDDGDVSPDTVDGGAGDDRVVVDDGDTVTGGEGDDSFIVWRFEAEDNDVVTVTDFNPETDRLSLDWKGTTQDADQLFYRDVEGGTMISYNDIDLAFLQNVTASQLPEATIEFAFT